MSNYLPRMLFHSRKPANSVDFSRWGDRRNVESSHSSSSALVQASADFLNGGISVDIASPSVLLKGWYPGDFDQGTLDPFAQGGDLLDP